MRSCRICEGCPALASLDLSGCTRLGDPALQALSTMHYLRVLSLRGCNRFSDTGMFNLFCPGTHAPTRTEIFDAVRGRRAACGWLALQQLHFCTHTCHTRTQEHVRAELSCLEHVDVSGCGNLTDASAAAVTFACGKNLRSFGVSHAPGITDTSLILLARRCPTLQRLCCEHLPSVTSPALQLLVSSCKQLVEVRECDCRVNGARHCVVMRGCVLGRMQLSVSGCTALREMAFSTLRRCTSLKSLNLSSLTLLTDTISQLLPPSLTWLSLSCDSGISDAGAMSLLNVCSQLKVCCSSQCALRPPPRTLV